MKVITRRSIEARLGRYWRMMQDAIKEGDESAAFIGARLYTHWCGVLAALAVAKRPWMRGVLATNAQFAVENETFRAACAAADIPPTRRQASKWLRGFGAAIKTAHARANRQAVNIEAA